VAADGRVDRSRARPDHAVHDRKVVLLDLSRRELRGQALVRTIAFRDHDEPGRPPIEAMNDARPQDAADARQVPHMMEKRVHQRAGRSACTGMDHQPGGLVYDEQVRVLVHDGKRDVLRGRTGRLRLGHHDGHPLAFAHPRRRPRGRPVDGHRAVGDEGLQACAAEVGQSARQPCVESLAASGGVDEDGACLRHAARRRERAR
jgi:hypothetical protein